MNNPLKFVDPLGLAGEGIGQTDEYIYTDPIREKLIDHGFRGPEEYTVYDLNKKIMDGAASVIQDFGVGLSFDIAKAYGLKVVAFETGYGYVATTMTVATVMGKYEKSNIIESFGGDKLEVYSYNEVVQSGDGKLGVQTTIINKNAYVITKEIDGKDAVLGVIVPASVTVSKTGTMSNAGIESIIFDFSHELLERYKRRRFFCESKDMLYYLFIIILTSCQQSYDKISTFSHEPVNMLEFKLLVCSESVLACKEDKSV